MLRKARCIATATESSEEALFRIKKAVFSTTDPSDKKFTKAVRYYRRLAQIGLLENFLLTDGAILQRLGDNATNCFLEIASIQEGVSGFLSTTSTETSLNRALNLVSRENFDSIDAINTISGMCLFGTGVDRATTRRGRALSVVEIGSTEFAMSGSVVPGDTIIDIEIEPRLSLYELEKINRLSCFLNGLTGPAERGIPILVTPRVQYYLYLMTLYEERRILSTTLLQWFDAVDERDEWVRREFSERVMGGVLFAENPLASIECLIRRSVGDGKSVDYREVLAILSGSSFIWRKLIKHENPRSWKRLINLSYPVAFMEQIRRFSGNGSLLIHVDDQVERVILSETGRLKKFFRGGERAIDPLVGMYLVQSILNRGSIQDSDLYYRRRSVEEFDFACSLIEEEASLSLKCGC